MRSVPLLTGSRPASMRSSVDFPQPDGPTSTMSSPSAIASVQSMTACAPFGYTLSICSKATLAIGRFRTWRRSVEEVLGLQQRQQWLHDGVGGEASLQHVIAEIVRQREQDHRLVEHEVFVSDAAGLRVDRVVETRSEEHTSELQSL